jgi:hypothetical protein
LKANDEALDLVPDRLREREERFGMREIHGGEQRDMTRVFRDSHRTTSAPRQLAEVRSSDAGLESRTTAITSRSALGDIGKRARIPSGEAIVCINREVVPERAN